MTSVKRHQGLPPFQTESVLASSTMDPALAKAESTSDAGGTSVIRWLRKYENHHTGTVRQKND